MGFIYSFVSLNPEQLAERRQLLDFYGQIAQLSALVPIVVIYLSHIFPNIWKRFSASVGWRSTKAHQSPRVSTFQRSALPGPWALRWRRFTWALNEEIVRGWDGWGTKGLWVTAVLWALWLLILVVKDTGNDYMHVTKRFGIVAASQLPLHYLLAAKSWSPLHYLLRMSHEELNPYHRLLGRILIAFFSAHAILYANFYIQSDLLYRFGSRTVILGLIAISTFVLIGTSSLQWLRNKSYLLFFVIHVALSVFLLPILWFHVRHLRVYIVETALVYILLIAQRNLSQTPTLATLSLLPSNEKAHALLEIKFPLPRTKFRKYKPGQHIYLGLPPNMLKKPWDKLRLNPFTVASSSAIPTPDAVSISASTEPTTGNAKTQTSSLLIRPLRSSTALLASLASRSANQAVPVVIEGPYGSATYFPDLSSSRFSHILLVAGGVGASFTLPIYHDLLTRRNGQGITFIWSVRRKEEAVWALPSLTRTPTNNDRSAIENSTITIHVTGSPTLNNDDDFELEERANLLSSADETNGGTSSPFAFQAGRPDLHAIVNRVFEHAAGEGSVAVLVCGPTGMGKGLRLEVGKWVGRGREVFWHAEEFGW